MRLTRLDCFSTALALECHEHELVKALAYACAEVRARAARELSEVRRLCGIFDTLSGRCLDFTKPGALPIA